MKVSAQISYVRGAEIGAGEGMNSRVFEATDPQLNGTIVVKEIAKVSFGNDVDSYYAEAQAMFAASHSHVVPVHYACETADQICLAMPYFRRGSLARRIEKGALTLLDSLRITHELLLGVSQVHQAKLLHLDIKPTNVLFDDTGTARLADFGQSRKLGPSGVASVGRVYLFGLAPEFFDGVASVESDLYQVGVTLYRMLNGNPRFQEQKPNRAKLQAAVLSGEFPDRDGFLPHVPKWVKTCVRKALRVEPAERYRSATDFAKGLGGVSVVNDWRPEQHPDGGISWDAPAKKNGAKALRVILRAEPNDLWTVEIYSVGDDGRLRAKSKQAMWRRRLSRRDAEKHLSATVFEALE